jgi:hypothetical protein
LLLDLLELPVSLLNGSRCRRSWPKLAGAAGKAVDGLTGDTDPSNGVEDTDEKLPLDTERVKLEIEDTKVA